MPNWKRVIVSGSDAILTSVTATAGFTGSLTGTASYATNALSASYAQTASYATYAANGGVTKILAGANVNLSPVNGLGDVTVTSFGTNLYNTATGSYGSFYDTGSVLAASATAVYSMSLSTTDISNGVFVSASNGDLTRVKFTNAGTYNVQFSAQFSNSDNTTQDVVIWVRKNGTDVLDSSGVVGTPSAKAGNNGQVVSSWNYLLNLAANDFIQICWHVEQANVITLETIAAGTTPTHPRTPSTILTATRVDTFLSNTGSFSGSFTGTLTGTASYATNALSASFAPSTPAFPYTGSAGITGSLTVVGKTQSTQIGAGTSPSGSVPLDVKAQGALSTDLALRVRNSGDTYNILSAKGDGNIQIGEDTIGATRSATISSTNTSQLILDTSYSTDTATISVARRIGAYNTNAFLFTQNAFGDGNVQPYKFHFVNPANYFGYTEPAWVPIYTAGFMFFKDTATAANLQMKITPDSVLTMYTGSMPAPSANQLSNIPLEVNITGSAFQLWASGSAGNAKPFIKTQNGTILYLGDESRLYNITASSITSSFTGSLFGTASYATTTISASYAVTASYVTGSIFTNGNRALSSSYAVTASYATNALSASYAPSTPAFPFTGSATISGSLIVRDNVATSSLNTLTRTLTDTNNITSVNWQNYTLGDSGGTAVNWNARTLIRSGNVIVDWRTQKAYDTSTSSSINWNDRELWDGDPAGIGYNTASLDWNNRIAKDANALPSINWGDRSLFDNGGVRALHWKFRSLYTPNTTTALNWADDTFLDSNVYQRDYKSADIQNAVSTTYNNPNVSYLGDIIEVDGISTFIGNYVTEGMLVYLHTNATWYPVEQALTVSTKLLGIAHNVGDNVGANTGWILLEGHVVIDDTSTSGPHVANAGYGLPIYIKDSTTTGEMSTVVPTTTGGPNIVRILGHCYQQNGGTASQWMMKFRPSNDWVEI